MQDFQNFGPARKRPAVFPLVPIHCLHELSFVVVIVALARGGIYQAPTFTILSLLSGILRAPSIGRNRDVALSAVVRISVRSRLRFSAYQFRIGWRPRRCCVRECHQAVPHSRKGGWLGTRHHGQPWPRRFSPVLRDERVKLSVPDEQGVSTRIHIRS